MSKATYTLKNTSTLSDKLIKRLIRFACKGWEFDVRWLNKVTIRGSKTRHPRRTSGHAYSSDGVILVTVSNECDLESLAEVVIHEVGHCATAHKERFLGQKRTRLNGTRYGGSEPYIVRNTSHIMREGIPDSIVDLFRECRSNKSKSRKAPKPTALEKRLDTAWRGVIRTEEKLADLAKATQRAERRLVKYRAEWNKAKRASDRRQLAQEHRRAEQ